MENEDRDAAIRKHFGTQDPTARREPTEYDKMQAKASGMTVEEYLDREDSFRKMQLAARQRIKAEREARRITGMGFWRLAFVVAVGILLAQVIGGVLLSIFHGVGQFLGLAGVK